ncbi:hypothetical protein NPIL_143191 [Nephila pilipes]|uniref:Uncharacterized protein n=1 Tax=Nephila pilipes TaxID=299642 RepID=A0A8X6PP81_NEPPI|nr:hypothetical protein NPIL_143191 [Nephila pilipes]
MMVAYWIMARCQSLTVCNLISCPEEACTTKIIARRKTSWRIKIDRCSLSEWHVLKRRNRICSRCSLAIACNFSKDQITTLSRLSVIVVHIANILLPSQRSIKRNHTFSHPAD